MALRCGSWPIHHMKPSGGKVPRSAKMACGGLTVQVLECCVRVSFFLKQCLKNCSRLAGTRQRLEKICVGVTRNASSPFAGLAGTDHPLVRERPLPLRPSHSSRSTAMPWRKNRQFIGRASLRWRGGQQSRSVCGSLIWYARYCRCPASPVVHHGVLGFVHSYRTGPSFSTADPDGTRLSLNRAGLVNRLEYR